MVQLITETIQSARNELYEDAPQRSCQMKDKEVQPMQTIIHFLS